MVKALILFSMIFNGNAKIIQGYNIKNPGEYKGLLQLYKQLAKDRSKDMVVTLDLPFYALGQLLDEGIYELENNLLRKKLVIFLRDLLSKNNKYKYIKCIRAKEGAMLLDAYIKVPLYLLTEDKNLLTRDDIKKEIELINGASGIETSPIFHIKEDYTQYIPRSHYTQTEEMERYFKAMMYLGRMGFSPFIKDKKQRSLNISAALILGKILNKNLNLLKEYNGIKNIIDEIVGKSDDLTPDKFMTLVKGYNVIPDNALCSETYDNKILKGLRETQKPGIFSTLVLDSDTAELTLVSIRLFGQRWIYDSYIFQNLVYNKVGTREKPRLMPSGLDLFSVMGSEKAFSILVDVYEQDRYKHYLSQMEKLRRETQHIHDSLSNFSLYHMLLGIESKYILSEMSSPVFLYKEKDYEAKKLITSLATWALLKHATLLYGKQSYTVGITSIRPTSNNALCLVEPYPDVIEDIRSLNARLLRLLRNLPVRQNLLELENLLKLMLKIALSERNGMPAQRDMNKLRFFIKYNNLLNTKDKNLDVPAKIADVHTDPNSKKVLEVGTGYPLSIVYDITEGRKVKGYIMSYYEFESDMSKRLKDKEWQNLLRSSKTNLPVWIQDIIIHPKRKPE